MSNYTLRFMKEGEKEFWFYPVTSKNKEDAIKEAEDFIERKDYVEYAYLEEIIHEVKEVWKWGKQNESKKRF